MNEEKWKPIKGYEGKYEASSKGRARSLDRIAYKAGNKGTIYKYMIKGRILKPKISSTGYYEYGLSNGVKGDLSHFKASRLVAKAFIPNPNNLPVVHHINHNKLDDRVENLKWVTQKENVQAEIEIGNFPGGFKIGTNHHNSKFTDAEILKMFDLEKQGLKRSEIADVVGCSRGYVTEILSDRKRLCTKL